jgi:hypothetical protein
MIGDKTQRKSKQTLKTFSKSKNSGKHTEQFANINTIYNESIQTE